METKESKYSINQYQFSQKGLKMFDNGYYVDKQGVIYKNEKILKQSVNSQGYKVFGAKDIDGKNHTIYTHHLVGQQFLTKPISDEIMELDHINQDRLDNRLDNLRWINKMENLENRRPRGKNKKKIDVSSKCISNPNQTILQLIQSINIEDISKCKIIIEILN